MKKIYKIFIESGVFILSFFVFNFLSFDLLNPLMNKNVESFLFSFTLILILFHPKYRVIILAICIFNLFLMAIMYVFGFIYLANLFGSLGIGILALVFFSYIPQLLEKGYVEKL